MSPDCSAEETPGVLLGRLAHEFSLLVRNDLELAAAERRRDVRQLAAELGVLITAAVAVTFTLAALTWAAVRGLAGVVPGWAGPLIVAAAWALVAGVLLRRDHVARLAARISPEHHRDLHARASRQRDQAEADVRATAERLAEVAFREAAKRELKTVESAAERELAGGEADVRSLLRELVAALTAPGRTGITLIERLVGSPGSEAAGNVRR